MDAQKFFLTELSKMTLGKDTKHTTNLVFKDCTGSVLMYYDRETSYLYVHYDCIWAILISKYNLEYSVIQDLIRNVLFKHLNWKVKHLSSPISVSTLNWKRKNTQTESNEIRNISF